jgi:hypothetical protein
MAIKTFNSFSGIDITATFGTKAIGTLQAISYSVNREKAAIYTMGRANPRAFSRGKRMIAGSLVFILFDENPMIQHFSKAKFMGDDGENIYGELDPGLNGLGENANAQGFEGQTAMKANYVDQIPPFDVILTAANEYGEAASMSIIGVELMNENSGFSIDDIVVEQQYTFIAVDITPWKPASEAQEGKETVGSSI